MKKYIILLVLLTSCDWAVKDQPHENVQNRSPQDIVIKTLDDDQPLEEEIKILPYDGKYSLRNRFWNLSKITKIKKDIELALADKLGYLQNDSLFIEIEYRDWESEYEKKPFVIAPLVKEGQEIWRITYVSEHLQNGSVPLSIIYKTAIAQILLRDAVGDHYGEIPDFLWQSLVHYGCGLEEYTVKKALLRIVNGNKVFLENAIVGLDSNVQPFPQLESLFLLIFLEEKYGAKNAVKDFTYNVLFNKKNWEEQLALSSGEDFSTFSQKVVLFAKQYLISRYRSLISKYNGALKEYLAENYGAAISKGQTFILNYHDSVLVYDMHFWMAMCYYELKNYTQCLEQLQNIFSDKRYFCHNLSLANYRHAMSLYRLQKLSVAIDIFADFRRDFPWETKFVGSALFFQAQSFLANNQSERAIYHFEDFIRDYPQHYRRAVVVEKMAYLYLQMERYQRAKVLFAELKQLDTDDKIKRLAQQSIQRIRSLEEQEPSAKLRQHLQETAQNFATLTKNQKQETLRDLGHIGQIALPCLESIYKDSQDVLADFIECIADIQSPKGISLLLSTLRSQKEYDTQIFIALANIGIPILELETIIEQEFQDVSSQRRKEISQNFRDLFWGATNVVVQKIPSFVEDINSDAKKQYAIIEKMNLALGKEQIPVLKKLVLHGKSEKVKIHALENLIVWQDETTPEFLNGLLFHSNKYVRHLALTALKKQKYYRITNFTKLFSDSYVKVREEALNLLPFVDISDKINILVSVLDDENYDIRNRARQTLIDAKDTGVNLVLAKGLAKDTQNISYYNYIVQILRVRTNDFELLQTYHPQMSPTQRKELAQELATKWK
ncbi:tetratricopeptide repeat protein [Candidatus Uabimicrobium amorphum]|uniref:Outer membrane lipoprotein BamD-like domain-containing protein n=1 Tax=Uabimicrobium amorphum TaxID=2596890 RepID=A0A5S9IJT7_UABAM|nr:tetratricopeptide repeat protein [Candidatus Uabimicrobium amorphum]BBM82691.1 hypothetical protein UABAM_01034 [Candidatus Uabimicrobium amorphum]